MNNFVFGKDYKKFRDIVEQGCHVCFVKMKNIFIDDVAWNSGWMHNFVCPECSFLLSFKQEISEYNNNSFICPNCGCKASGEKYKEAWIYLWRRKFAEDLLAIPTLLDNQSALDYLTDYVDFYAEHYHLFRVHGEKVGKGKIMAQSLDEAVFGINILRAIMYSEKCIPENKMVYWKDYLFVPMAQFLAPQGNRIHNVSV